MGEGSVVDGAGGDARPAPDTVWKEWMRQFGKHIRRVREFLGLSQDDLAQRAGVSQGAVSRFEGGRGVNTPFLAILRLNMALARELNAMDPAMLDEQVKKFLRHMEFLCVPTMPGGPPAPAGVEVPKIQLTADPDVERLVRQYRAMPESGRRAFIAALTSLSEEER
jgi:DNA-binding XRE family transcriptional regulator